eukprot:2967837-Alexandrium_andersonii.AAC.1
MRESPLDVQSLTAQSDLFIAMRGAVKHAVSQSSMVKTLRLVHDLKGLGLNGAEKKELANVISK